MFQFFKKIFSSQKKGVIPPMPAMRKQSRSFTVPQRSTSKNEYRDYMTEEELDILDSKESSRTLDTNKYEPLEVKSYVSTSKSDYEDSSRSYTSYSTYSSSSYDDSSKSSSYSSSSYSSCDSGSSSSSCD